MKYIFAAGCMMKRGRAGHLLETYQRLSEKFGDVVVYHRDCRKEPLFSGEVTIISDCPSCRGYASNSSSVSVISLAEALA